MPPDARMAGLVKLERGVGYIAARRLRAVLDGRPRRLDCNGFCSYQRVFEFDAQIPNSAVRLCIYELELNGAQVARLLVN